MHLKWYGFLNTIAKKHEQRPKRKIQAHHNSILTLSILLRCIRLLLIQERKSLFTSQLKEFKIVPSPFFICISDLESVSFRVREWNQQLIRIYKFSLHRTNFIIIFGHFVRINCSISYGSTFLLDFLQHCSSKLLPSEKVLIL